MSSDVPKLETTFCQGLTPQSRVHLSASDVASKADAISQGLEEASKAAQNVLEKFQDNNLESVSLSEHDRNVIGRALHRATSLPIGLIPADLQPLLDGLPTLEDTPVSKPVMERMHHFLQLGASQLPQVLRDFPILPPLSIASGPPRNFDYGAAIKRARMGVMIELSTIPLYLYAIYSVKPKNEGIRVQALVRAIVQQEMLHLALSGNLLSALGGSMVLYDPRVVPIFPGLLLCEMIPVHLEPLTRESLGRFMEIEAPADAHQSSSQSDRNVLASQYDSIGQLYEDLLLCVRGLSDQQFTQNLDKQFVGLDFFGDQLFAVIDQSTALRTLRTIIEQGEGSLRADDSHYDVFSKLYSGPAWDVYKVPTDPGFSTTVPDEGASDHIKYIYRLSLSFDAAYCYLLQTIQSVWATDNISDRLVLFRNIHGIMSSVLTPLAELLVQQKLEDASRAAPCFMYYPMNGSVAALPLDSMALHQALVDEVTEASQKAPSSVTVATAVKTAAKSVHDSVNKAVDNIPADFSGGQEAVGLIGGIGSGWDFIKNMTPDVGNAEMVINAASSVGQNAVKLASLIRAYARTGTKTDITAALKTAYAAEEVEKLGEAVGEEVVHATEQASLQRLISYIGDHLYPPF